MEVKVNVSINNFNTTSLRYATTMREKLQQKEKADYKPPTSTGMNIFCINFDD